jgi:glutamyl-tRNA synthetase
MHTWIALGVIGILCIVASLLFRHTELSDRHESPLLQPPVFTATSYGKFLATLIIKSFITFIEQSAGTLVYRYFSFIASLFIFILICNWIAIFPGVGEPTKDLSTTLALGTIALLYIQKETIKVHGFIAYIKDYFLPISIFFPLNIIIRIEDTDPERNVDPEAEKILSDLAWLHLSCDEGPQKSGPYAPYFQSKRTALYAEALSSLREKNLIYPCFCTAEELEKKRQRQLALKQPPRYDRACRALSQEEIKTRFAQDRPFIWRFILDHQATINFYDLAHKMMHFELKHFSDVPLTRQDGSFTFLFANFVDDVAMKITHVFRGEDHLTNTAVQVALYEAFQEQVPVFCHLPILGNIEGKKLSKRDFGFSLTDLQEAGFLPEALTNYLAIIGHSVTQEIMSMHEMIKRFDFDHLSATGQIKYDVEKLRWVNHQWIMNYDLDALVTLCQPFLIKKLPEFEKLDHAALKKLIAPIKQELVTLAQSADLLKFVVQRPELDALLLETFNLSALQEPVKKAIQVLSTGTPQEGSVAFKALCNEHRSSPKDMYSLVRLALTGSSHGLQLQDLLGMLTQDEIKTRLEMLIK